MSSADEEEQYYTLELHGICPPNRLGLIDSYNRDE